MKKLFLVVYEKGKKNYSGFAPDIPGCGSIGKTLDDIRVNLHEALQLYVDTSVELGHTLPEPVTGTVTLPIEGEIDPKTTYVVEHVAVSFPRPKLNRPRAIGKAVLPRRVTTRHRTLQAA